LVDSVESMMMHGLYNPKFKNGIIFAKGEIHCWRTQSWHIYGTIRIFACT